MLENSSVVTEGSRRRFVLVKIARNCRTIFVTEDQNKITDLGTFTAH